jgi:creatinine amidohydrolase/Fe(II)-dependent formamide hydrolase-like protein
VELYHLQGRARAWACTGYELVEGEIPEAGDHAAAWETSLMLALRPDLVDLSRLPAEGDEEALIGVWGRDPRKHASVEFGRQGVEAIVRRVGEKVRGLLG